MTATEKLRAMLDERGVEWTPSVFDRQHETFYSTENGVGFIVTEFPEIGRMSIACDRRITPEQAIEATLGRDGYSYEQWREISNAVGDAMEYAHDKAIECPDKADPLWNLDEYVNRILKVAFEGEATLGRGECRECASMDDVFECSACGARYESWALKRFASYCPDCGRKVRA